MTTQPDRAALIERLREEATLLRDSGFPVTPHLMKQAAAMLEADAPAVPQEPVGYVYWEKGHAVGALNNQTLRPGAALYTAPQQQPRLTDEEIEDFADASTGYSRMVDIKYFARAIEKKVRGEA